MERAVAGFSNQMAGSLAGVGQRLDNLGTSGEKAAIKAQAAFKKVNHAANILGGALLAIGGLSLKSAADFETAFTDVQQNVKGTSDELNQLEKDIRAIGASGPDSAANVAEVAAAVGELGLKAGVVDDVTKNILDFAAATGQALPEATDEVTRFIRATGTAPEALSGMLSAVLDVSEALGASEANIVDFVTRLAPTARAVGITTEELIGLAGAAIHAGLDSEKGGKAFSMAIGAMSDAISKNGDELKAFAQIAGMTTEEFAQLFQKDAAKAIQVFLKGLKKIDDTKGDTLHALDAVGLGAAGVGDALLRASSAADDVGKAYDVANKGAADNASLTAEAAKRNEDQAKKLATLKNKATDLAITLGESLTPALSKLIDILTPLLGWIKDHSEAFGIFLIVLGGVVLAVKALNTALALANLAKAIKGLWGLAAANEAVAASATTAAAAEATVPAAAISGLAVLGGISSGIGLGLAGVFVLDKFGVLDGVARMGEGIGRALGNAADNVGDAFRIMFPGIMVLGAAAVAAIKGDWSILGDELPAIGASFLSFWTGIWDGIKAGAAGIGDFFSNIGRGVAEGFQHGFSDAWEGTKGWMEDRWNDVKDGVKDFFGIHSPSTMFADFGENLVAGMTLGMGAMFPDLLAQARAGFEDLARTTEAGAQRANDSAAMEFQQGSLTNNAIQAATTPPAFAPAGAGAPVTQYVTVQIDRIEIPVQQVGETFDLAKVGMAVRQVVGDAMRSAGL